MVRHQPSKLIFAGSNPVSRSLTSPSNPEGFYIRGPRRGVIFESRLPLTNQSLQPGGILYSRAPFCFLLPGGEGSEMRVFAIRRRGYQDRIDSSTESHLAAINTIAANKASPRLTTAILEYRFHLPARGSTSVAGPFSANRTISVRHVGSSIKARSTQNNPMIRTR